MQIDLLFGSQVRARTLETLALTPKPLSAYRIAKVIGAQPIQVSNVLKSLEPGLTVHSRDGWVLENEQLRRFLRSESAREEGERRSEKDEILRRLGFHRRRGSGSS